MPRSPVTLLGAAAALLFTGTPAQATSMPDPAVTDDTIAAQRSALAASTEGAGFGPQSPRDIDAVTGSNARVFEAAPARTEMNLCNIHFHESAEHKGGEFTDFRGNGDGKGAGTGYVYSGDLSEAELAGLDEEIGAGPYGSVVPGDTIEVHYVYSTAQVVPGPTLGACLSESVMNPQLRVEAQVFVLVNDEDARDFVELTRIAEIDGLQQAPNLSSDTGTPVQYSGSTTGPGHNEAASPLKVTWSVRPGVARVDIRSVGAWFEDNVFDEHHAHSVRNLVMNPDLLSPIVN